MPTISGATITNGKFGLRAELTDAWSDALANQLLELPIAELLVNDAKGWSGKNVEFLSHFPNLQAVEIGCLALESDEPVHRLTKLRSLTLSTYCKTPLRFNEFAELEFCYFYWRAGCESLFERSSLTSLMVFNYKGHDTSSFGKLTKLESLTITDCSIRQLSGLQSLQKLKTLDLAFLKRMRSLEGIENLINLENLTVTACRQVQSLEPIRKLEKLRRLDLSDNGEILSLEPISNLSNLEKVCFIESTNILDGNLSPLQSKKYLRKVIFQDRAHYSHKSYEFWGPFKSISIWWRNALKRLGIQTLR
jgi:Leucine-rich repeat (LRR) protein